MRFAIVILLSACTSSSSPGTSYDEIAGTIDLAADDGRGHVKSTEGAVRVEPYVPDADSGCEPSWVVDAPHLSVAANDEVVEGGSYEVDGMSAFEVASGEAYWLFGPDDCSVPEQGCSPRPARARLDVDELPDDGLHATFRVTGPWCFGDLDTREGVCDDMTVLVQATGESFLETRQRDVVDRDSDGQPSTGVGWPGFLCLP